MTNETKIQKMTGGGHYPHWVLQSGLVVMDTTSVGGTLGVYNLEREHFDVPVGGAEMVPAGHPALAANAVAKDEKMEDIRFGGRVLRRILQDGRRTKLSR